MRQITSERVTANACAKSAKTTAEMVGFQRAKWVNQWAASDNLVRLITSIYEQ
jgi:hypothetical protein